MPGSLRLTQSELEFYRPLIASYLRHGSVDKVFADFSQDTGVSYPHFHRILKQWGIIKSAGPQSHFSEAIYFLTALAKEKLPLEAVYKKMPPSLKISAVTLHRILGYIKRGLTRRRGTALIISQEGELDKILIGRDLGTPRPELGKPFGSLSLPMTYSKRTEPEDEAISRVIQQEVMSRQALERVIPDNLAGNDPHPLITIDIADVRVSCYRLVFPKRLAQQVNSQKLQDLEFVPVREIALADGLDGHYRAGVPEIAQALLESKNSQKEFIPHLWSNLNKKLALLPVYTK